ncbi:MAG: VWA domain-containing protein [Candidatus Omnitrophica bacterium]|nr:VWA domain-containing protein [Candidatus Omnitrophota bacterium]
MFFKNSWILFLIPLVFIFVFFLSRKRQSSSINFSSGRVLEAFKPTLKVFLSDNIFYLRGFAVLLFIIALAGPRSVLEESRVETEGVEIVMAIDSSGSMLAEDFKIGAARHNRLEVVKKVAEDFIQQRTNDRIGLVTFAALAYTVCPLTTDQQWLISNLQRIKIGAIEDGTAIGSAVNSSLNRLKKTKAKSKIIILLTDGVNNSGNISPLTAAKAAKALGVKIYTIGVGTKGPVPYPVQDIFGRKLYQNVQIDIDEDTLKQIAETTDGRYYLATDTESLKNIYHEIDSLEKTKIEKKGLRLYKELFFIPLLLGLLLLISEAVLKNTWLRKIP